MRYGRISTKWRDAQHEYNKYTGNTKIINIEIWASKTCQILLETTIDHCKERNHFLHDSNTDVNHERDRLHKLIKNIEQGEIHHSEKGIGEHAKKESI